MSTCSGIDLSLTLSVIGRVLTWSQDSLGEGVAENRGHSWDNRAVGSGWSHLEMSAPVGLWQRKNHILSKRLSAQGVREPHVPGPSPQAFGAPRRGVGEAQGVVVYKAAETLP